MRLTTPHGEDLWLGYGMNVHAGGSADAIERALDETVVPLRTRLGARGAFGVALRLDRDGARALLHDDARLVRLRAALAERSLVPFTANAFVAGAFHEAGVKDSVYLPSWRERERADYTVDVAEVLAALSASGSLVSVSTVPLGWKAHGAGRAFLADSARALVRVGRRLDALEKATGVRVMLGLEPEPLCALETVDEAIAFFRGPLHRALGRDAAARRHLGVCYDVCHQAVEWEDPVAGLDALRAAGVPVVKVQASSALEAAAPLDPATREALRRFAEPRWLHQVVARGADGLSHRAADLPDVLDGGSSAGEAWAGAGTPWRVHFHVPVHREQAVPPLSTTRPALERALRHVVASGTTTHVEIETYTWDALPAAARAPTLVESLAREHEWVLSVLEAAGVRRAA